MGRVSCCMNCSLVITHLLRIETTFEKLLCDFRTSQEHFWYIQMASKRQPTTYTLNPLAFDQQLIQHGATISLIANRANLDRRVVARASKGLPVSMSTITAIARFFGVELMELGVKKFSGDQSLATMNGEELGQLDSPIESLTISTLSDIGDDRSPIEAIGSDEELFLTELDASDEFASLNEFPTNIEINGLTELNANLAFTIIMNIDIKLWDRSKDLDIYALSELIQLQIKMDIQKRSPHLIKYPELSLLRFSPSIDIDRGKFILRTILSFNETFVLYAWFLHSNYQTCMPSKNDIVMRNGFSNTERGLIRFIRWATRSDGPDAYHDHFYYLNIHLNNGFMWI
jgi:hypothetical protein